MTAPPTPAPAPAPLHHAIAFAWGMAEATVFFIVPDVWFTWLALRRGARHGAVALAWALLGALLGGAVMYGWAAARPADAVAVVARVPGVRPALFQRARADLQRLGVVGLAKGGVTFLPYKVYAVVAPEQRVGLAPFLVSSTLARGARFLFSLAMALLAAALVRRWRPTLPPETYPRLLALFWTLVYGLYFGVIVPRL